MKRVYCLGGGSRRAERRSLPPRQRIAMSWQRPIAERETTMNRADEGRTGARTEALREALTMMLYVSIVLLAELAALPKAGHGGNGIHGWELAGLAWGTAMGLALAHWFSFRLAARLFSTGQVHEIDILIGVAQVGGAVVVALLSTVPLVFVGEDSDIGAMIFVPALIVGATGFATARSRGRSASYSLLVGLLMICAGFLVAAVKNWLVGH